MGVWAALLGTFIIGSTQVVLPVGKNPELEFQVSATSSELERVGVLIWDESLIWSTLTGSAVLRQGELGGIAQLLRDADEHEGHFDTAMATELRLNALKSFHLTPRPSNEMRSLVARITHDLAAGWLIEGDLARARSFAASSLKHFGSHGVDSRRHSPRVIDFFSSERLKLKPESGAVLRLRVQRPGTLYIDGDRVAEVETAWSGTLMEGEYRIWVKGGLGWSLPYPVVMEEAEQELLISNEYDHCWELVPKIRFVCGTEELDAGFALLGRLGIDQLNLVEIRGAGEIEVHQLKSGEERESSVRPFYGITESGGVRATLAVPVFEPKRYLPLGVGQFIQGRPLMGLLFLGLDAALIAWNIGSALHFNDLESRHQYNDTAEARNWQNASAALAYTGLLSGVLEAFLFDPER